MSVAFNPGDYPYDAPANDGAAVTPSDSVALTYTSRSLYVGVAGNVKVTMAGGGVVTFVGVPAGAILPVRVTLVWSTNTTASSIIALW